MVGEGATPYNGNATNDYPGWYAAYFHFILHFGIHKFFIKCIIIWTRLDYPVIGL
jgi:hypothetical protein